VEHFWDELETPPPHIPITRDGQLFGECAKQGESLIWLHTFGSVFSPKGQRAGVVLPGRAKCEKATSRHAERYPNEYSYDNSTKKLSVGDGLFINVSADIWRYSISGFRVLESWLQYRMRDRKGKKSSALDDIRPESWVFDKQLLQVIWVLEATLDVQDKLEKLLDRVLAGPTISANELPSPREDERDRVPRARGSSKDQLNLFT
jgi:hypothetical protein